MDPQAQQASRGGLGTQLTVAQQIGRTMRLFVSGSAPLPAPVHAAFAARYDQKPWVRYVDVGSIGDWGEGHTWSSTRIPTTFNEVKTNIDL